MDVRGNLNPQNCDTWKNENFPNPRSMFLSNKYATQHQAFKNRVNPNVIKTFSILYDTRKLVATMDFWGLKRGTLSLSVPSLQPHTDLCTLTTPRGIFQGLIALNDNTHKTGCFVAYPGSMQNGTWTKHFTPRVKVAKEQAICMKKGCMVVWDRFMTHANKSNKSTDHCRFVQYMRLIPHNKIKYDRQNILDWPLERRVKLNRSTHWSDYEKKVLGINKY
jgi:ectoine hydroxylase-related dioxygenase (phytanoyl-CoA dioxygenase family)